MGAAELRRRVTGAEAGATGSGRGDAVDCARRRCGLRSATLTMQRRRHGECATDGPLGRRGIDIVFRHQMTSVDIKARRVTEMVTFFENRNRNRYPWPEITVG